MEPTEADLRKTLERVAPGTELREALDNIIAGRSGALIVMGDIEGVEPLCNGGFRVDIPFTAQRLFELAKLDGAIVVDDSADRILAANVHLVPDHTLPTAETGMRHRAAERTSRQTRALVISISQRRDLVSLYMGGRKVVLQRVELLLAKADQALQALQRYRARLDQVLTRLTGLEFDDLVTVDDVGEVIRRFEMVLRVSAEVSRYISELGNEGRLVRIQAEELTVGVEEEYTMLLRDYAAEAGPRKLAGLRERFAALPSERLLDAEGIAVILGFAQTPALTEEHVRPRGYRSLKRIPMLPGTVIERVVDRFGSLNALMGATAGQLDDVDGVGSRRANAILEGLERLRRGRTI